MKISNEKLELAMANECITRNELAKKSTAIVLLS